MFTSDWQVEGHKSPYVCPNETYDKSEAFLLSLQASLISTHQLAYVYLRLRHPIPLRDDLQAVFCYHAVRAGKGHRGKDIKR